MNPLDVADRDPLHLYPPFRGLLQQVLAEAARRTRCSWYIAEGYRSPERQRWLYALGRTRSLGSSPVTWMRFPKWHGSGLAADVYPRAGGPNADRSFFEILREVYLAHGLTNPAWQKGDLGHVQMGDEKLRIAATNWCAAGFPSHRGADAPPPPPAAAGGNVVVVMVNGIDVPQAQPYLEAGRCYVALRPVCNALGFAILKVGTDPQKGNVPQVWIEADPPGAGVLDPAELLAGADLELPLQKIDAAGTGFIHGTELSPLCSVVWNGETKHLKFFTRPDPHDQDPGAAPNPGG